MPEPTLIRGISGLRTLGDSGRQMLDSVFPASYFRVMPRGHKFQLNPDEFPCDEWIVEPEVLYDGPYYPSAPVVGVPQGKTWLYVMRCGEFAKVGITRNVDMRLSSIRLGNPYPVEVLHTLELPTRAEAGRLERALHAEFAPFHHFREWFHWTPEVQARCACLTSSASS